MSPSLLAFVLLLAVVCFVLGAFGLPRTVRRPVALGWIGAALFTLPALVAALQAL